MSEEDIYRMVTGLAIGATSQRLARGNLRTVVVRQGEDTFVAVDWDTTETPGSERYTTSSRGNAITIASKVHRWLHYTQVRP